MDQLVLTTGRILGCGKFFEGTPAEMHAALNKVLAALPDDTKVFVSIDCLQALRLGSDG